MLMTLWRYILRELAKWLFPALLIFTFFMLPFYLHMLIRQNLPASTIILILPHIFPFIARYVLPPAILTGTIMAYGRLTNDNEFAAAQAGGVWPGWLVMPAFLIGLIVTFITLFLNESVITYSANTIGDLWVRGSVDLIERKLEQQGVVQISNYHLYRFPREHQRQALDMTIYKVPEDLPEGMHDRDATPAQLYPSPEMRIFALDHYVEVKRAKHGDVETTMVVLNLMDCQMQFFTDEGMRTMWSETATHPLELQTDNESPIGPNRVQCWGISKLLSQMRESRQWRDDMAAEIAEKQDKGEMTTDEFERQEKFFAKEYNKSMSKYRRALHSRLGLSFSCVLFALVGTFLGIVKQRGGRSELFGTGFGISVLYFVFFLLCKSIADIGGWVLWLPNIGLLAVAVHLWRKVFWAS